MIVYNQVFDYYHAIYRLIRLLTHYRKSAYIEVDRLRIWDFYLLFPDQVHFITIKQGEEEIRQLRKRFLKQKDNPYNKVYDNQIVFERLKPYQLSALQCLVSYGLINRELLRENRVSIISAELLLEYNAKFEDLTYTEQNVIALMTLYYSDISLFGPDGLKSRTKLMTSKYDV